MTEAAMDIIGQQAGASIEDRSIAIEVSFKRFGIKRKVSATRVETDADKDLLALSKAIIDSEEWEAIRAYDAETRKFIARRAVPSNMRSGTWLISLDVLDDLDRILQERRARREQLVDVFMGVYEARARETAGRLGSLADHRNYPEPDKVRDCFAMRWSYKSYSTPARLKSFNKAIYDREVAKARIEIESATQAIKDGLRGEMLKFTERLVTQLQPGEDGKRRKIHDSLVGNMEEFLTMFQSRNLADDGELAALVDRARLAMQGVDPELLKSDAAVRDRVSRTFGEIKQSLDSMIVTAPTRLIDLSEED